MRKSVIAILFAGILVSSPSLAATRQSGDDTGRIDQLERRADALKQQANRAQQLGAVERDEIQRERREIREMIEQLETGGAMAPQQRERIRGR
jgi:hypothetical protein